MIVSILKVAECHTITFTSSSTSSSSTPLPPSTIVADTQEQQSSYTPQDEDGFQEDSLTGALLDRLERVLDQVGQPQQLTACAADLYILL